MFGRIVQTVKFYCAEVLKDNEGFFSSKRLVMFLGSFSLAFGYFGGMIYNLHVPDNMVSAMEWLTGGGLVATASEKFAPAKPPTTKVND